MSLFSGLSRLVDHRNTSGFDHHKSSSPSRNHSSSSSRGADSFESPRLSKEYHRYLQVAGSGKKQNEQRLSRNQLMYDDDNSNQCQSNSSTHSRSRSPHIQREYDNFRLHSNRFSKEQSPLARKMAEQVNTPRENGKFKLVRLTQKVNVIEQIRIKQKLRINVNCFENRLSVTNNRLIPVLPKFLRGEEHNSMAR